MNAFEKVLHFLEAGMPRQYGFGWFHLMFLSIVIGMTVFIALKFKNADDKTNRKILLTFAGIMLFMELYKQLVFSYNGVTDVWDYQWYAFPFQFCSVPMYVMLIAGLVKNGKFQDSLFAFLATYGLFAGIATMALPNDMLTSTIGINIQTLWHHGSMIIIGVYMLASGRAKLSHKTIIKALPVFAATMLIAIAMNTTANLVGLEETFNMFFINPIYDNHLPVLSIIYDMVPFVAFLFIYAIGFTFVGYLMIVISMGIKKLANLINRQAETTKE